MATPIYATVALLAPFFIATTSATFEDVIPAPHMYDSSSETGYEASKRFPEHFNNIPPSWLWFNVGECPETEDGVKKFFCPSATIDGKSVCIDDHQLCNGVKECPNAEDEAPKDCLFHKALKSNILSLQRDVQNLYHSYVKAPSRRYMHGITHQQEYN